MARAPASYAQRRVVAVIAGRGRILGLEGPYTLKAADKLRIVVCAGQLSKQITVDAQDPVTMPRVGAVEARDQRRRKLGGGDISVAAAIRLSPRSESRGRR